MDKLPNVEQFESYQKKCKEKFDSKIYGTKGNRSIVICGGCSCLQNGADSLKNEFERKLAERGISNIKVTIVGCFGFCSRGPFVKMLPEGTLYHNVKPSPSYDVDEIIDNDIINNHMVTRLLYVDAITKETIVRQDEINFFKKQLRIAFAGCGVVDPSNINEAIGYGSYLGLVNAFSMGPQDVIQQVLDAGLRGREESGNFAGKKWQDAYASKGAEKFILCNTEEADQSSFMDRSIMEGNPIAVIEGLTIAGYAIGSHHGYIYLRSEYEIAIARVKRAIEQAYELGLLGENILGSGFTFHIHLRYGPGEFICGEETALINTIEGNRPVPKIKPPYPTTKGLWDKPTVVHNVETLAAVPYILRYGPIKYSKLGNGKSRGTKIFALGGKINNSGLAEIQFGTTLRQLIYDIGGGIPNGRRFKAVQIGGPNGTFLNDKELDIPLDFENIQNIGAVIGSASVIVMDEDNCIVDATRYYTKFIVEESCGKCTACRIGMKRILELLEKITDGNGEEEDLDKILDLAALIKDSAACDLGRMGVNPVISSINKFRQDYLVHINEKKCPSHICKNMMSFRIDPLKCKKCSLCARSCPSKAIVGEIGRTVYEIDQSKCVKCGACVPSCRFNAISKA